MEGPGGGASVLEAGQEGNLDWKGRSQTQRSGTDAPGGGARAESGRGEEEPEWDKSVIQEADQWRKPEPRKGIEGSDRAKVVGKGRSRVWETT